MILRWLVAGLHLLALGIGLGAVVARARALRGPLDNAGFSRVFVADNFWGLAAALWLATGLWRAFGGLEKGTAYYVHQPWFLLKMTLFALVFALELRAMRTLIQWRRQLQRQQPIDTSVAPTLARISHAQAVVIVLMIFVAAALARGVSF